ncbi:MAG: Endoribonuclease YbeY [Phycisphaerae bacterium]|nr:Endoribonuclease YbeY [Phycisphaerae bacterium]
MDEEPPYQLSLSATPTSDPPSRELILRVVREVLRRQGCARAKIHVALVPDACIADLNERFLQHEGATDVLSFDLSENRGSEVEGEIVISVDTALREARRRGHDPGVELALYAAHGALHLLGWDDGTEDEARLMHARADDALEACGLARIAPKGDEDREAAGAVGPGTARGDSVLGGARARRPA